MENVRAVERSLEILECFSEARDEIGLSELARSLMLPKATVFRLARTLEDRGYLVQVLERQTYRLGPKVAALGHVFLANLDYRAVALPFMKVLRDEIHEAVSLYIAVGDGERMCVQRVESTHALRQIINIGDRLPINRGSAGKLLIAFQHLDTYAEGIAKEELQRIREQGYAVSIDERGQGLSSISVPIRNNKGDVIASLTVSGPEFRFTREHIETYIKELVKTAKQISYQLGYLG